LIDPQTGTAFGVVSRKATGLSKLFNQLRATLNANIALAQGSGVQMRVGPIDYNQALVASQNQMLMTLNEIERQANVGIGYAFSAEHVIAEPCLH
jgi:hypothetical protein